MTKQLTLLALIAICGIANIRGTEITEATTPETASTANSVEKLEAAKDLIKQIRAKLDELKTCQAKNNQDLARILSQIERLEILNRKLTHELNQAIAENDTAYARSAKVAKAMLFATAFVTVMASAIIITSTTIGMTVKYFRS